MSKAVLSDTGSKVLFGVPGGGQVGCLSSNKRQVVSLFGAIPLEIATSSKLYPSLLQN